jgi:hypothetical protein
MFLRKFFIFLDKNNNNVDVVKISAEELKKLTESFYISRTGVEMIDCFEKGMLSNIQELPPMFQIYGENRKSEDEYKLLDDQLISIREKSRDMREYRQEAEKIHYANCTSLACFLCTALEDRGVKAKVFGLGGAHHFVIAKNDQDSNSILVIDPWTNTQFQMKFENQINNLEDLSGADRLNIAEKYSQKTGLYQNYRESLDEMLSQDNTMSEVFKEQYTKNFFEIESTERWFYFNQQFNNNP